MGRTLGITRLATCGSCFRRIGRLVLSLPFGLGPGALCVSILPQLFISWREGLR